MKAVDDIDGSGIDTLTYDGSGAQAVPQEILSKDYDPLIFPERATTNDFLAKTLNISAEGITNFTFHSKDRVGNMEAPKTYAVKIDKSFPITNHSSSVDGLQTTITLTAIDTVSGVSAIFYSIDGGALQSYSSPFVVPNTGGHYINYFARDVAGNEETPKIVFANSESTLFDYDGDLKSDLSVFRPSDNSWYLLRSQLGYLAMGLGTAGDMITPADYDGDGKTDIAMFRPSNGTWYIFSSDSQSFQTFSWGADGDMPVPADHDGDGKADLVVFRPSTGQWFTRFSLNNTFSTVGFGVAGDKPVVGDFDGDGKADIALFRPSDNNWYILKTGFGFFVQTWGEAGDIPVPADYDGDGKTDVAVFRPSTGQWFRIRSTAGFDVVNWGVSGDKPIAADYDGDGKSDVAVFRPSNATWYIVGSMSGQIIQQYGQTGDLPTEGAFIY